MPTLRIPTPLRPYTGGESELNLAGETVGAVLEDLSVQHPTIRQHIFTDEGELRAFVNLFLNDEDVQFLDGTATQVGESDRLMILPSIAGG
jgi:molybdopterin converting factor small subunit